jgi:hypothetical protein
VTAKVQVKVEKMPFSHEKVQKTDFDRNFTEGVKKDKNVT